MATEENNRAKEQARAQLDSIVRMVKRLQHAQECAGDEDCELTDEEILEGLELHYEEGMTASEEDREQCHDEDAARQAIEEDPLSVQVRSDWHSPGEESEEGEYEILLCTGGPAVRITGDLGRYSEPVRITGDLGRYSEPDDAQLEYQDWFTAWERYCDTSPEEDEALLYYARCFYFGK